MFRLLCVVAIAIALPTCVRQSNSWQSPETQNSQAAIEEAKQLSQLTEKLYGAGKFQNAMKPAARALALREKALGPTHPDVAESLSNLAMLYQAQGTYSKAEPLFARALAIDENALGPNHPDVAACLNNLAVLYENQAAYDKAEPLLVRALEIDEKVYGTVHPEVATDLNNLARLYQIRGEHTKAEPLFTRALEIREKALGPMHPLVAASLNNLAMTYEDLGEYAKAEPLLVRALAIREKVLAPTHPAVAYTLSNLAELYQDQGAYAKAEPLLVRALDMHEKALGPMHPDVATDLNNLAVLYQEQGVYAKSEPLLTRALAIREKALGATHPDVAITLTNLARIYFEQRVYTKAETFYRRALEICEKALGPTHQGVGSILNNLAALYRAQGEFGKAEPLYTRALDIREKLLIEGHPLIATTLSSIGVLHQAEGDYGKAESFFTRAVDTQEQLLRTFLVRLPEARKRALMANIQEETDHVISLHADEIPDSASALELALTTVLRRKGRILDSLVDNGARLRNHLTPDLRNQLDELSHARSKFAAYLYAPEGSRSTTDRTAITAVRARIDELESALSAASANFRTEMEPVTLAKVKAALPANAALVEFVRYRRFDLRQAQQHWQEDRYLAYLVIADGSPQWVALGEAATIDAQIDAALTELHGKAPKENTRAALRRLDALVFTPIRARLSGVSHLILAPDGRLNLLPFEALVDPHGHYAFENYLVSYVTSGRDLLRFAAQQAPRSSAVIMAGPDYGPSPPLGGSGVVSFPPLPGAVAEATDLRTYFPAPPLTGEKATKFALAQLAGPAMLHIATHGFYAQLAGSPPRPPASAVRAQAGDARGMFVDGGTSLRTPSPRSDDLADALDRSGLAMTGANLGAAGIVTAREIAGFDLWGTQLVVLSACETGAGAASSGDGVYGMRRALVLAGAVSQVVSLWNVSDASTRALMRDYYGELARGTGRAEALRRTKLRLMRQPGYAHPYYWATFIPAGDWRPLDKTVFPLRNSQP